MKMNKGFTLVELMVAVAIVSILAAIAVPSYSTYVTRSRIPDATSYLATKQVEVEQYFLDNRTYADAPACALNSTTSQYFDFSCDATPNATTYTLRAVGKGAMTGFAFTINQSNAKTTVISAGAPSGWTAHTPNNCWVTNKGGSC